ncbi:MAG TPA: adenylate/guanylate cyclase domain-containing protein, partial [Steroidobacteraceae bacterium]|nr:adenylate/guanylate cyclase domain-containing protein [Steroidobacteraceae bacterium]
MRQTRRLAAILAADVAGYSRLIGADEEGTLNRLKSIRADVIDPKIAEHRGRIVKTTGDGLLVEFSSVVDALRCATEVQNAMAEGNAGIATEERIEFRIGINVGDIVVEDGDIFGDGVNVAARLEGLAEPGGIYVSARVQEDVAGRLDLTFDDLGEQSLKNISRSVRVYRVRLATAETAPKVTPTESGPALTLPDKPSIAVLPFANMSGDPEQEYFADGMVEEIITALSRIRWLFVIARNSSFTYKGKAVDVKQVGRELGVRYVLEGSVRKAGNRVRITGQLIDATVGNHIWAERYDRELADIFAVQDEITERVVATIEPELYAAEHLRSQRKPPESLDAWECVIRALSCIVQSSLAGYNEAEALCRRAITVSPHYGQAHSLLSWLLLRRTDWSGDVTTFFAEAEAEARTALAIDERDPWAHLTHGLVLYRQRRHDEAERAYRRALELNPNFALVHAVLGLPLAYRGAHQDAIESAERAMMLSPNDPLIGRQATHTMAFAEFAAAHYAD